MNQKNSVWFGLALLAVAVFSMAAWACIFMPDNAYPRPPYIDLAYEAVTPSGLGEDQRPDADKSVTDQNPFDHFSMLLLDFSEPAPKAKSNEASANMLKDENEPYIAAIRDLLRSKQLNPKSVQLDPLYDEMLMCDGNKKSNVLTFLKTVFADPAVTAGYVDFVKVRTDMQKLCQFENDWNAATPVYKPHDNLVASLNADIENLKKQPGTGDYPLYLAALLDFYNQQAPNQGIIGSEQHTDHPGQHYEMALAQFSGITGAPQHWWNKYLPIKPAHSWVQETSAYMIGRVHLILAQTKWDGESEPGKAVDQNELAKARDAFHSYLTQYPDGRYADSTKGLERKILFLSGNQDQLNVALRALVNHAFAPRFYSQADVAPALDKLREYQHYHKGGVETADAPLVVAFELFQAPTVSNDTIAQLEKRRQEFDAYPGLLRFLRAYILSRKGDYKKLLDTTPSEPVTAKVASLSVEAMRAHAFEKMGDTKEALQSWKNIAAAVKDDQAQLHIAGIYAATGDFNSLFGKASGISNLHILSDFAFFAAPDQALWDNYKNADVVPEVHLTIEQALYRRLLLQRNYAELEKLIPQIADPNPYAESIPLIHKLNANPEDAEAHLNLAELLYKFYLRPNASVYTPYDPFGSPDIMQELKPVCPSCKSVPHAVPPIADFLKAEAILDKSRGKSDAQAKNLYYLVRCFRGSEFQDRCKWSEKGYDNKSKEWWQRLHSLYPGSNWANETPYYY